MCAGGGAAALTELSMTRRDPLVADDCGEPNDAAALHAEEDDNSVVDLSCRKTQVRAFVEVLICGAINNFSYCIVSGASQDLARFFNMGSQTSLLTTAMNSAALLATFISSFFLLRFQYYTRVRLVLFLAVVTYGGVGIAAACLEGPVGFAVVALAACAGSMGQVVGETSNIAFLKSFPPSLLGAWGAGTGVAGISGGGVYILLRNILHLSNPVIFALCALTLPIYWAAYHDLERLLRANMEGPRLARALGGKQAEVTPLPQAQAEAPVLNSWTRNAGDFSGPCVETRMAVWHTGDVMFNLVAVYCLEYFIYPGLDDRETVCASPVWYTAMWMCYNVGVTLSRLSVGFFRIRRVWLLTCFQLFNVIFWTTEVLTGGIRNALPDEIGIGLMTMYMVPVGLCGGAAYANCMYLFNTKAGIPHNIRELGVNLAFVMSNIGITASTFSFSFLSTSIMSKDRLYPHGC